MSSTRNPPPPCGEVEICDPRSGSKFRVGEQAKLADQRARQLRAKATDAEGRLWGELRVLKVKGLHFRRQAPIGRYYVDSAKLVVELDGRQHCGAAADYNAEGTEFLRSRGYTVLRFWNFEVMRNRQSVVDAIFAVATLTPTRNLLPALRGRKFRSPRKGEVVITPACTKFRATRPLRYDVMEARAAVTESACVSNRSAEKGAGLCDDRNDGMSVLGHASSDMRFQQDNSVQFTGIQNSAEDRPGRSRKRVQS